MDLGWETTGFNDSGWDMARAPYPGEGVPSLVIPGTAAQFIWHDPSTVSNGKTGVTEAFFRHTFELDIQPDSIPLVGQALVSVDDDYDLFVNGNLIYQNHDNGFASVVDFVDFTSYLRNGVNVIAINAVDGGWGDPRDRLYERVLFDGAVSSVSAVPVPGALWLFLSGLVAVRFTGFNQSKDQLA